MDTTIIKTIESFQVKIVDWINTVGELPYSKLYRGFTRLLDEKNLDKDDDRSSSLFYKTIIPLVKLGIVEYGIKKVSNANGTYFYSPIAREKKDIHRVHEEGYKLLRFLPSVSCYINNLAEVNTFFDIEYKFDLRDYKLYPLANKSIGVGLYKQKNYIFYPFFLRDVNNIYHKVERRMSSFECLDYAFSYVWLNNGCSIYSYNSNNNELTFYNLDFIPPFVIRALCLVDYEHYENITTFTNNKITFIVKNKNVISEIERIFKRG